MKSNPAQVSSTKLPQALKDLVERLAEHPDVEKVILFGSRARGDVGERSDIDLAVSAPNAGRRQWLDLIALVEEAETLLPIDLIRVEEADRELQLKISEEGKILYERSEGSTKSCQS